MTEKQILKGLWVCGSRPDNINLCIVLSCPYIEFGHECARKLARDSYELIKEKNKYIENVHEACGAIMFASILNNNKGDNDGN